MRSDIVEFRLPHDLARASRRYVNFGCKNAPGTDFGIARRHDFDETWRSIIRENMDGPALIEGLERGQFVRICLDQIGPAKQDALAIHGPPPLQAWLSRGMAHRIDPEYTRYILYGVS